MHAVYTVRLLDCTLVLRGIKMTAAVLITVGILSFCADRFYTHTHAHTSV